MSVWRKQPIRGRGKTIGRCEIRRRQLQGAGVGDLPPPRACVVRAGQSITLHILLCMSAPDYRMPLRIILEHDAPQNVRLPNMT